MTTDEAKALIGKEKAELLGRAGAIMRAAVEARLASGEDALAVAILGGLQPARDGFQVTRELAELLRDFALAAVVGRVEQFQEADLIRDRRRHRRTNSRAAASAPTCGHTCQRSLRADQIWTGRRPQPVGVMIGHRQLTIIAAGERGDCWIRRDYERAVRKLDAAPTRRKRTSRSRT